MSSLYYGPKVDYTIDNLTVNSSLKLKNSSVPLTVTGDTQLNTVTANGAVTVYGTGQFPGGIGTTSLTVANEADLGSLVVYNSTQLSGTTLDSATITHDASVGGNLTVTTNTKLGGVLDLGSLSSNWGSATAPKIKFDGDTGIYSTGDGTFLVSSNGVQRLKIFQADTWLDTALTINTGSYGGQKGILIITNDNEASLRCQRGSDSIPAWILGMSSWGSGATGFAIGNGVLNGPVLTFTQGGDAAFAGAVKVPVALNSGNLIVGLNRINVTGTYTLPLAAGYAGATLILINETTQAQTINAAGSDNILGSSQTRTTISLGPLFVETYVSTGQNYWALT